MKAILNYYADPKISEQILIGRGDKVVAVVDEFGLEDGMIYEVKDVNGIDMITVELDCGVRDIFSVENFTVVPKFPSVLLI